jgi:outer membrane protein insertion porin family
LGLGETLSLGAQIGTLQNNVTFGFTEPYLFDKPIQTGFTVFYTRFSYDQGRQESILLGQNLIPYFNSLPSSSLLNYTSNGAGFTTFASYQLRRSFARVGLSYSYSGQTLTPISTGASDYFKYLNFQGVGGPNSLSGIRTSTITPTYAYNTVNHPIIPTHGLRVNASVGFTGGVIGGNVNTLQPSLDIAYFRKGIFKTNVMGFHLNARFISGYGGKVAPPYSRYYMGGEDDIRGFDILTISPIAFLPTSTQISVLNNDGSQRVQKFRNSDGSIGISPVTQTVPAYQLILPGGDTAVVFNYEYRIPIVGPVTLAPFLDAGIDKLTLPSQLGLNPDRVTELNGLFPQADFGGRAYIAPDTQVPRVSVGLELQVLMPVVNAPFRVYWAYNLSKVSTNLQPPVAADRSFFPNNATYQSFVKSAFGQSFPYNERSSLFRFSIGRTF